jgi:hypothetical protein
MRRILVVGCLAAVAFALAPVASAAAPTHWSISGEEANPFPAGTVCDFNYIVVFSYEADVTSFGDRETWHWKIHGTHINLDTRYSVRDDDTYNVMYFDDHEHDVGVFWHIRDPNGKIVAVHGGELYFSDTSERFTPNSGGSGASDYAAVICPALGGHAVA